MQQSRRSKYGNRKTSLGGQSFDSKREATRYAELKLMERAGKIHALERQVHYRLIPNQTNPETGKTVRGMDYIADFVYWDNDSKALIVEDAKGYQTDVYKIKKKLMLQIHGIWIKEV